MSFSETSFFHDALSDTSFSLGAQVQGMSFSPDAFSIGAFSDSAFAVEGSPTPSVVIDTHDAANEHYRKRALERAKIREEIERLVSPTPLTVEAIAASQEPMRALSGERVEQMIRALEEFEREREDEEIVLMAIQ